MKWWRRGLATGMLVFGSLAYMTIAPMMCVPEASKNRPVIVRSQEEPKRDHNESTDSLEALVDEPMPVQTAPVVETLPPEEPQIDPEVQRILDEYRARMDSLWDGVVAQRRERAQASLLPIDQQYLDQYLFDLLAEPRDSMFVNTALQLKVTPKSALTADDFVEAYVGHDGRTMARYLLDERRMDEFADVLFLYGELGVDRYMFLKRHNSLDGFSDRLGGRTLGEGIGLLEEIQGDEYPSDEETLRILAQHPLFEYFLSLAAVDHAEALEGYHAAFYASFTDGDMHDSLTQYLVAHGVPEEEQIPIVLSGKKQELLSVRSRIHQVPTTHAINAFLREGDMVGSKRRFLDELAEFEGSQYYPLAVRIAQEVESYTILSDAKRRAVLKDFDSQKPLVQQHFSAIAFYDEHEDTHRFADVRRALSIDRIDQIRSDDVYASFLDWIVDIEVNQQELVPVYKGLWQVYAEKLRTHQVMDESVLATLDHRIAGLPD